MLTLKVSPGKLYKRLNYGEKKFFLSLVHKNKIEKKINRKANEIPNYWNIKLWILFYLTLRW